MVLRFDATGSNLAVVLEDDGKVAYAYLLEDEAVVADVWLYNVAEAPASVDWDDPDSLPFLNPREYCRSGEVTRLGETSAVSCRWIDRTVEITIDGILVARLQHGTKPGWSRFAARPSPLANPLYAV